MSDPEVLDPTAFVYEVTRNGMPESEIERARRLGTWRRIDRSKQYEGRYSPEMLLRGVDHAHKSIRELERQKFWYAVAVVLISGAVSNAAAIGRFLELALRWLGLI